MLPTTEQSSIGVTISGDSLMKIYPNENFQETKIYFNYTLWNISCKRDYRDLRPLYYKASEGIIIPLTYDTISQLPDYFFEIQRSISVYYYNFPFYVSFQSNHSYIRNDG